MSEKEQNTNMGVISLVRDNLSLSDMEIAGKLIEKYYWRNGVTGRDLMDLVHTTREGLNE